MARSLADGTLAHRAMDPLADQRQLADLGLDLGALLGNERRPDGVGPEAHPHGGLT
jgi:hypothetical protein